MNAALRAKLLEVAAAGRTIFYSELGPWTEYSVYSEHFGELIGQELDEINRVEHECGRPLLSAVVISKQENVPGRGFFECAKELGVFRGHDSDMFWLSELRRVHDYWRTHDPTSAYAGLS